MDFPGSIDTVKQNCINRTAFAEKGCRRSELDRFGTQEKISR